MASTAQSLRTGARKRNFVLAADEEPQAGIDITNGAPAVKKRMEQGPGERADASLRSQAKRDFTLISSPGQPEDSESDTPLAIVAKKAVKPKRRVRIQSPASPQPQPPATTVAADLAANELDRRETRFQLLEGVIRRPRFELMDEDNEENDLPTSNVILPSAVYPDGATFQVDTATPDTSFQTSLNLPGVQTRGGRFELIPDDEPQLDVPATMLSRAIAASARSRGRTFDLIADDEPQVEAPNITTSLAEAGTARSRGRTFDLVADDETQVETPNITTSLAEAGTARSRGRTFDLVADDEPQVETPTIATSLAKAGSARSRGRTFDLIADNEPQIAVPPTMISRATGVSARSRGRTFDLIADNEPQVEAPTTTTSHANTASANSQENAPPRSRRLPSTNSPAPVYLDDPTFPVDTADPETSFQTSVRLPGVPKRYSKFELIADDESEVEAPPTRNCLAEAATATPQEDIASGLLRGGTDLTYLFTGVSKQQYAYGPECYKVFHFDSPYVADHIIREDREVHRSKAKFRPPPHASDISVRHIKEDTRGPYAVVGPDSPPLAPKDIALDRTFSSSQFNPPLAFNYTIEQLEELHGRIAEDRDDFLDYDRNVNIRFASLRNELQMHLRNYKVACEYRKHAADIEHELLRALAELEKM